MYVRTRILGMHACMFCLDPVACILHTSLTVIYINSHEYKNYWDPGLHEPQNVYIKTVDWKR